MFRCACSASVADGGWRVRWGCFAVFNTHHLVGAAPTHCQPAGTHWRRGRTKTHQSNHLNAPHLTCSASVGDSGGESFLWVRWRVRSVGGPFVDTSQLDLDRLWVILVSGDSYHYSDFICLRREPFSRILFLRLWSGRMLILNFVSLG